MVIGDAMGMPSQTLTRAEIARQYTKITTYVVVLLSPEVRGLCNNVDLSDSVKTGHTLPDQTQPMMCLLAC